MFAGYRYCEKCGKALMGLFDGALCDDCEKKEKKRWSMKDYSLRNEKIKLIHALATSIGEHMTELFENGYDQGYKDGKADTPFTDTEEAENKAYNRGLADMLEAVKSMRMMTADDLEEVFGLRYIGDIFVNLSPSKIVSKYHAFKARIKELEDTAKIKVGDEVIVQVDRIGFVTGFDVLFDRVYVTTKDGWSDAFGRSFVKKTGRTFPQIAEVLKEMRGAEDDE